MKNTSKAGLLVTAQFTLIAALGIAALANARSEVHDYLIIELIMIILGLLVLFFAWKVLRPSLQISPLPKEGAIFISRGIYKYVRHPMYLGVILIGFGLASFGNSAVSWILELLLLLTLNFKASFEDDLLRERYPEAAHYQKHTAKVMPCLSKSCRGGCDI
ncbi:MAG: DUF1295 domain-containing protein [Actinobacteria bacterium]|nr:DUF1295 domain-containing protein [Actinomycetota bacterium]